MCLCSDTTTDIGPTIWEIAIVAASVLCRGVASTDPLRRSRSVFMLIGCIDDPAL